MHNHVADPSYLVGKQECPAVRDDPFRPCQVEHIHQLELQKIVTRLEPSLYSLPRELDGAFAIQPDSEPVNKALFEERPGEYTRALRESKVVGLVHLREEGFHPPASRIIPDRDSLIVEVRPANGRLSQSFFTIPLPQCAEVSLCTLRSH